MRRREFIAGLGAQWSDHAARRGEAVPRGQGQTPSLSAKAWKFLATTSNEPFGSVRQCLDAPNVSRVACTAMTRTRKFWFCTIGGQP